MIHNEKFGNSHEVKSSLNECLRLDPSLNWVKEKLICIDSQLNSESQYSLDSTSSRSTSLKRKILCKWNMEEMNSNSSFDIIDTKNYKFIGAGKQTQQSIFDTDSDSESEYIIKISHDVRTNSACLKSLQKDDMFKKFKEESFFSEKSLIHKQNILKSLISKSIVECFIREDKKALFDHVIHINDTESADKMNSKKLALRSYIIRQKELGCSFCYR